MAAKLKADVLQALDAWKAGKPVRSIELGHVQRMTHTEEHLQSYPNTRPQIDLTQRVPNDQDRIHAYVFAILSWWCVDSFVSHAIGKAPVGPDTYEDFQGVCAETMKQGSFSDLSDNEKLAAESLAWKALLLGWKRAIDGFPEAHYIEVTNLAAGVSAT